MPDLHDPQPDALPGQRLARLPQRLRRRLAALSAVGAMIVMLPLVQVLRFQNAEVAALMAEQAGLDPVLRAVQLQRGLLAHGDLAGQVLRGRAELEPERRARQGDVDDSVFSLTSTLQAAQLKRALLESHALHEDWTLLAAQVLERSIGAGESDQAHRLLLEQTLQVMDLVADTDSPRAEFGKDNTAAMLAVVHGMPRLAGQLAILAPPHGQAQAAAGPLAALEATLARTLGRLDAAPRRAGAPLAEAGAAAGATADRYLALLREPAARVADVHAARGAALQAQWRLFDLAHDIAAATLSEQIDAAQLGRTQLLSAVAALSLLALALVLQLWLGLGTLHRSLRTRAAHDDPAPGPNARPAGRAEAGLLLQRLRRRDAPAVRARRSADQPEPQAKLPPED